MITPPNLNGEVSQKLDQSYRQVIGALQAVQDRIAAVEKADPVSKSQAQTLYSASAVSTALQSSGSAPLNVTQLQGVLAQPQNAAIPSVTALPTLDSPLSQDGALVAYNKLIYRFDGSTAPGAWLPLTAVTMIEDTHAHRLANYPPANYQLGSLFWETDRTLMYAIAVVGGVNVWKYLFGVYASAYADKPVSLTLNDDMLQWSPTEFRHKLQYLWASTSWGPAPGEVWDAGKVEGFLVDPSPVDGWALCDGSGTTYLDQTGNPVGVTLPDLVSLAANAAYMKLGSPASATPNAAVAPTATVDAIGANTGSVAVQLGLGTTVASNGHTHGAPNCTVSATGAPRNVVLRPFFRR